MFLVCHLSTMSDPSFWFWIACTLEAELGPVAEPVEYTLVIRQPEPMVAIAESVVMALEVVVMFELAGPVVMALLVVVMFA